MTKKATEDQLSELHRVVAEGLTDVIRNGQTVSVGEDGEPVKAAAPAAYYAAALKMLADNNITADPATNAEIAGLTKALAERHNKRRGALSKEALEAAAVVLERDLGGTLQ
jgi:hypothetical protein